jgi:hypothetical protein
MVVLLFSLWVILKTEIYLTVAMKINKAYGTFDENRAAQNGYQAFPFQAGKKTV